MTLASKSNKLTSVNESDQYRFLVHLEDDYRKLADPVKLTQLTLSRLGVFLNANRCSIVEIDEAQQLCRVIDQYTREADPATGEYDLTFLDNEIIVQLKSNHPHVVTEAIAPFQLLQPHNFPQSLTASPNVTTPILQDGKLVAFISVQQQDSRQWTPSEVTFIGVVAQRCWELKERNRIDSELRESEARLHLALNASKMGVWEWNVQTGKRYWSRGMSELHGLPTGTTTNSLDEYLLLVHPEDHDLIRRTIATGLEKKEGYRFEYRIVDPLMGLRWIEAHAEVVVDTQGEPLRLLGVCFDITGRKKTEHNLTFLSRVSIELAGVVQREATLKRIAQLAVPTFADWCSVELIEDGLLHRVAVHHIDPNKVQLAHYLHEKFPPSPDRPNVSYRVAQTGEGAFVPEITDEMIDQSPHEDEYKRIVKTLGVSSFIAVPLKVQERTIGVLTFVSAESKNQYTQTDFALAEELARRAAIAIENEELYESLRRADRSKDIFLATVSHELRNPLAPITTGIELIKLCADNPDRVRSTAQVMERQVKNMVRLVDDLMDISRITKGKIDLRKEKVSLASVLQNAIESCRSTIEAEGHQILIALPGFATDFYGDPIRLEQIFSNLLNNAAKYTAHGGKISIILDKRDDEYLIKISDTGVGIDPSRLKDIFNLFTQESHPLQQTKGGLGIGLALVQGLVALHDGKVEAKSEGKGKGSEFIVHLKIPDFSFIVPNEQPASHTFSSKSQKRVLFVDDNKQAADSVAELGSILGHTVSVAYDGIQALEAVDTMPPDIVFLDIGMPGLNGYEVAQRIRSKQDIRQPTLIALTGWGQTADKLLAKEAGFDKHLTKPIDVEVLKDILNS